MMPPHDLDDVFESLQGGREYAQEKLVEHPRFQLAMLKAEAAYAESVLWNEKNPGAFGNSPKQQARVAFLDTINDLDHCGVEDVAAFAATAPSAGSSTRTNPRKTK